jgi:hypothetical protein
MGSRGGTPLCLCLKTLHPFHNSGVASIPSGADFKCVQATGPDFFIDRAAGHASFRRQLGNRIGQRRLAQIINDVWHNNLLLDQEAIISGGYHGLPANRD